MKDGCGALDCACGVKYIQAMQAYENSHLGSVVVSRKKEAQDNISFVPFLETHWENLSEHSENLRSVLRSFPQLLSGFSIATLAAWRFSHGYRWTYWDDTVLISCHLLPEALPTAANEEWPQLLAPVGIFSKKTQERLLLAASKLSFPLKIHGVSQQFLDTHREFVRYFDVYNHEDGANYIYSAESLATLAGRKLQKKRNLVYQAKRSYLWQVVPLRDVLPQTLAILPQIYSKDDIQEDSSLKWECVALRYSLEHFQVLNLDGIAIVVDDHVVAFSLFEPQLAHRAVIHFEKALKNYKGIYQVVNQEAARILWQRGFTEINREEDMGNEGLRQAKMSYHPLYKEPSYILTFKG